MKRQLHRRRRTPLSCAQCRRRKIKCDRKDPCSNCVTVNSECNFDHFGTLSSLSRNASTAQAKALPPPCSNNVPSAPPPLCPGSEKGTCYKDQEQFRSQLPGWPPHTSQELLQRRFGLGESCIHLNKTKTLRSSHWMGFADQFMHVKEFYTQCTTNLEENKKNALQGSELSVLTVQAADLLWECKIRARAQKAMRPSRSLLQVESTLSLPARDLSDVMARLYFQAFESTHRVLHVPTFWDLYEKYWKHPSKAAVDKRLLICLVLIIGAALCVQGEPGYDFREQAVSIIHTSETWLSGPLEKDCLSILGLQIHCLLILARQLYSVGGDLTWMSTGSLVHRAMQMGLHRDPEYLPSTTILEAEVRRRLWATILEFVVQSSLDSAMSPRISFEEFDTKPPLNINDVDLLDSVAAVEPRPTSVYTEVSTQLLLYSAIPVRLLALRLMNDLHANISYQEVVALGSEIIDACRASRGFLERNESLGATIFHRNMTEFLLRRFIIPLFCPYAMEAHKNPLFDHSLQVCLDSAMSMIHSEVDVLFDRLLTQGAGMIREGIRLAVSVLSIHLITLVENEAACRTPQQNPFRLQFVKEEVERLVLLAENRIENGGETNVKIHMFLSMILSQAEAIRTGGSIELAVARSARDSVQFSCEFLRKLSSTPPSMSADSFEWLLEVDAGRNPEDEIGVNFLAFPSQTLFDL